MATVTYPVAVVFIVTSADIVTTFAHPLAVTNEPLVTVDSFVTLGVETDNLLYYEVNQT